MPVMLPRQSDVDMHREGSHAAYVRPFMPSLNADECTAHQDSNAPPTAEITSIPPRLAKEIRCGKPPGILPNYEGKIKETGTTSARFLKLLLSAHWLGSPRAAPHF